MKNTFKKRLLVVLLVLSVFSASCGFLLYPERRGQGTTGDIDPVVLIMDCAWLFVFVVPGIVALAVDFTTGGMYIEGTALNVEPGRKVALRLRGPAPADANLRVVIVDSDSSAIVAILMERDFKAGEELEGMPSFAIPRDLEPGAYTLAVDVNGVPSSSWNFKINE